MHIRFATWIFLALMLGTSAHAQTWSSPVQLQASPFVFSSNTCAAPWQYLLIDDFALTGWQQADV